MIEINGWPSDLHQGALARWGEHDGPGSIAKTNGRGKIEALGAMKCRHGYCQAGLTCPMPM